MIKIAAASAVRINNAMVRNITKFLFSKQIERVVGGIVIQLLFLFPIIFIHEIDSTIGKVLLIMFIVSPSVIAAMAIINAKRKYKRLLGVLGVTNESELDYFLEHSEHLKHTYTFLNNGMVVNFTKLEYFYIRDIQKMIKGSFNVYYSPQHPEMGSTTETVTVYEIKISLNKHDRLPRKFRLKYESFIERDAVFLNLAKAYSEYGDPIDIVKDQDQLK